MLDLSPLLEPKSVAIIGVSRNPSRIGGRLFKYIRKHGYTGQLSLVNPKYKDLEGVKCYSSISDISSPIDCALIAVPEKSVISVLHECAANNVRAAIIFSSGFAEMGGDGRKKQDEIKELADKKSMQICGPNCIGLVNFGEHIALSFSQLLEIDTLIPGPIGFISQSGALGGSLVNRAQDMGIGLSYFISSGNEAQLDVSDYIKYLVLHDEKTKVIALLMEGIKDAQKFVKVAELALEHRKPIVALKIGETEVGQKAAASHTGSMASSDSVIEALFTQKGIVRVYNYDDLLQTASLLSKAPKPKGNRVGILTSSGGGGIIMADYYAKLGLKVPEPSQRTKELASKEIASFGKVSNPFDLTGQIFSDPEMIKRCMNLFIQDENFDIIQVNISMVAGQASEKRAQYILESAKGSSKPVVTWWAAGSLSNPGIKILEDSEIAFFRSPERCARAVTSLVKYSHIMETRSESMENHKTPHQLISFDTLKSILATGDTNLSEHQSKVLLSAYGIPVTKEEVARSADEAITFAEEIGFPVVMKIDSPDIAHKSDANVVRLGISSREELLQCYEEILENGKRYNPKARINGVLVQEMIRGGTEVMVGMSQDPQFGPTIVFGLGGIFVEVLKDISLRVAPLSKIDAQQMVREIEGYEILRGIRGKRPSDIEAIVDILLRISRLAEDLKDYVSEIDINPLIVLDEGQGVKALDALVVLRKH